MAALARAADTIGETEEFARCLESPAARDEVAADKALVDSLEVHGLPYTYLGTRAVSGFNPDAVRKLGAQILDGDRPGLPIWAMLAAVPCFMIGLSL